MSNLYLSDLSHEEIAFKGASLIDEFFAGIGENVLLWSGRNTPDDTALVYGDLFDPAETKELFTTLLRYYFDFAEIRELSYVEYFDGEADPIWVMLVEVYPTANLPIGVTLCRCASIGWSLQKYLKVHRYKKRWLDPTLKLLVPGYPDVDRNRPLSGLILG